MAKGNNRDNKGSGNSRRPRKKVCPFCVDQVKSIDYKEPLMFKRYVSEKGKILARRISGLCAKHQRMLTRAIKRSRHIALLPYTSD